MIISVGDLYALGSAATFAISSSMIKRLNIVGSAVQLNFLRTLIGAVLFPLHLILIRQFSSLSTLSLLIIIYLSLSVIFNVVIGDSAFFEAQNRLGIKIATPLVNTFPFFTIVFGILLLGESVTTSFVLGSIILIPGIILLSLDKVEEDELSVVDIEDQTEIETKHRLIGLGLILLAIACYTAGIIFTTVATRNIGSVLANSIRLPVGAMGLFILASSQHSITSNDRSWQQFSSDLSGSKPSEKLIILIAGIFGTYLSSLFLVLSVQEIGASRSAVLFSTGPFFALPLAFFWLRERIGWKTLIGTILTVIGLWIILG